MIEEFKRRAIWPASATNRNRRIVDAHRKGSRLDKYMSGEAIIYVNTDYDGFPYLRESVQSAESIRQQYVPGARYILYTNNSDFEDDVFDEIVVPPKLEKKTQSGTDAGQAPGDDRNEL